MKIFNQNIKSEEGNVLFLILIAVALFAALSYAVTQSTRSGGGNAGDETNLIQSSQITQYPASINNSVVRMQVSGGVDQSELAFNAPSEFSLASTTANLVFHPDGGGASYRNSVSLGENNQIGPWIFKEAKVKNIGRDGTADLVAFLPGMPKSTCSSINNELGLESDMDAGAVELGFDIKSALDGGQTETIIDDAGTVGVPAAGSEVGSSNTIGGTSSEFDGQAFGCFTNSSGTIITDGTPHVYYHVILEK